MKTLSETAWRIRAHCGWLLALSAALLSGCGGGSEPAAPNLAQACAAFAPDPKQLGAAIDSITLAPAGQGRPQACVIRGSITTSARSTINFKFELPGAAQWNGKTLTIGGGGFDGFILTDIPDWPSALLSGYPQAADRFAVISSDSGHQGKPPSAQLDFSWVLDNPDALTNHAYRANHLVLQVATRTVQSFYGRSPQRRYMLGLSNGGRAGLVSAQRYPGDYDGVVALAPAISQQAFAVNVGSELIAKQFSEPGAWLSASKIAAFQRAQIAACDAQDGLADGVISHPEACQFDPAEIQCTGADRDDCLTPGQVASVRRILSPMRVPVDLADGFTGYAAYGRGAESEDWPVFMFGSSFEARDALNYRLAEEIARYAITGDPSVDVRMHNPIPYAERYRRVSEEIDATNPDLAPFAATGAKIIIWHGAADACVSYKQTGRYFDAVVQRMGKEKVRNFARFFVSPAVAHGMRGPGANAFDLLGALDRWVESGDAPDGVTASKLVEGRSTMGRPLCEYGTYPRYQGKGDPNDAASFTCTPMG
jgi:pimeloyl-ACP methyl ester carboxylesterase